MNFILPAARAARAIALNAASLRSLETPSAAGASQTIMLGMPHLCLNGLSEQWLIKECGHRHWLMIAAAAGKAVPDFHDADGTPVYAAFCAATLRDAKLHALRENDELVFSSDLARISRTQFVSVHRLSRDGVQVGELELVSVFVKRQEAGKNRSIMRVALEDLPPVHQRSGFDRAAAVAAMMRTDRWSEHFGFRKGEVTSDAKLVIKPCPSQDFNGAGFLYFAAFPAFIDRAEWELFDEAGLADYMTTDRDVVYHGNIEPGERVVVRLLGKRDEESAFSHWFEIIRENGGAKLADVFTRRELRA